MGPPRPPSNAQEYQFGDARDTKQGICDTATEPLYLLPVVAVHCLGKFRIWKLKRKGYTGSL